MIITLRKPSRIVARTTVLTSDEGHPFSFTEPAGHYIVSTAYGTERKIVITAGHTAYVRLKVEGPCV